MKCEFWWIFGSKENNIRRSYRLRPDALELELMSAIIEVGSSDFLLATLDLQALFVGFLGRYYNDDVVLWLRDKLTQAGAGVISTNGGCS